MKLKLMGGAATALMIAVLLLTRFSTGEPLAQHTASAHELFPGNYELVRYESFRESGEVIDMDYVGRIMYDEHGNMSAIGMSRTFPGRAREAAEPLTRGGFAYFARYELDPEDGRVTHNVYGSPTHPSWVDTGLVRYFEFDEDLLMLSIRDEQGRVTGTLTWRRFP